MHRERERESESEREIVYLCEFLALSPSINQIMVH